MVLGWAGFWGAVYAWPYPKNLGHPPAAATWLEDRNGVALAAFVADDDQWQLPLTAEEINPHLVRAIIAVEDRRFYEHAGVDWPAATVALWQNMKSLRIVRGASTLTMQVERLRDPQPRSWFGKIEQAIRACQIERGVAGAPHLTKNELLLEYINRAPFGGNLIGAGAASWRYFGKPCKELSLGQCALFAGLPQSPNRFRPDRFPERAAKRRDFVLDRMLACNFITADEAAEARREPLDAAWRPLPQVRPAGHPGADGALPTLAWLGQQRAGTRTRVTLDSRVQQQALAAVQDQLRGASQSVTSAAVVILDVPTGEVLAAVSVAADAADVDLTRSARSSGSALKPFIYAAAFESGDISPASVLEDSPHAWAGYVPSNYDKDFRGPLTAAEALAESRNIPAMVVLARSGIPHAVGIMNAAGLRSIADTNRYGLSLAIGGAEVTPLELAEGYATLARGGVHRSATFLVPETGSTLVADSAPVLPAWACWQTLHALALDSRTEALCPTAVKTHVAWKTGTSNGFRDAWCAATTRQHTVVAWLGNAKGGPGDATLTGTQAAAPLALRLIAALDGGQPDWPIAESPYIATRDRPGSAGFAKTVAAVISAPPLSIVSPAPNQEIVLTSDDPANRQLIALSSVGGHGGTWWFVDDEPVAKSNAAEAARATWWVPVAGSHEIRIVDAAGHAAKVHIRVR